MVFAALASASPALAQAGSIGGTIGKRDKSVSGGEEEQTKNATRPGIVRRTRDRRTSASRSLITYASGPPCAHVAGVWTYPHGDATFKPDGSIVSAGTNGANWSCSDGHVTVVWKGGSGFVDQLTLSTDGTHLVSLNNYGFPHNLLRKSSNLSP